MFQLFFFVNKVPQKKKKNHQNPLGPQDSSAQLAEVGAQLTARSAEVVTLSAAVAEHRVAGGGFEETIHKLKQQVRFAIY